MTFKVGDKVRINFPGGTGHGEIGEVLPLITNDESKTGATAFRDLYSRYRVSVHARGYLYYEARHLELVEECLPREIKFEEIKKGDLIRCTRKYGDEGEVVVTVRVFDQHDNYRSEKYWRAEDQTLVINASYRKADSVKYELLDRIKPKLPTEEGALIQITKAYGKSVDNVQAMYLDHAWVSGTKINDFRYHGSKDIQEWVPLTTTIQPVPFG